MIDLTFRRATADDASRLRDLMEHAFSTNDSRPNWTGDAELASNYTLKLESMQAALAMDGLVTFAVLNEAGDIIASVNVARKGDDTGRISGLIVQDEYQRGGVGGRVLTYAEEYCKREWEVSKLSLNALSTRTALLAWYKSRGYRETGETSEFPRDDDSFASCTIPEDLCFVEMSKDPYAGESAEKLQAQ
ncbi:hypothetical protein MY5147_000790 [Beauveria neobassiana]|uniref:N-acetyltransferase domain-containing protein n=2 Tax=Beauveria bassiana TaxID=176275 RepID=A0A0A2VPH8_BEABA|nr:hypothetical protein BBAD15_g4854 [Beauveria bassiana D1-5]PQK13851.1 hypothetical protein BB8028_0004g07820 [Beauveria bassiana]